MKTLIKSFVLFCLISSSVWAQSDAPPEISLKPIFPTTLNSIPVLKKYKNKIQVTERLPGPDRLDDSDKALENCIKFVKEGGPGDTSDLLKELNKKIHTIEKKSSPVCVDDRLLVLNSKFKKTNQDVMAATLALLEIELYASDTFKKLKEKGPQPASEPAPLEEADESANKGHKVKKVSVIRRPDPVPDFCRGILITLQNDKNALADLLIELGESQRKIKNGDDPGANEREANFAKFLKSHFERNILDKSSTKELTKKDDFQKMDSTELSAVQGYTGSDYSELNRGLRDPVKSADWRVYRDELNAALDKIPDYHGEVHRGSDLPNSVLATHQIGSVVNYSAFTSTSTSEGFNGNSKFIIYSLHGKYVDPISIAQGEKEVLFKAGTKFRILDRQTKGYVTEIVMVEVP